MSRNLPNDPFRFSGDPAEADKHLPHMRHRRERRLASAPPPKPEPEPPKAPEDREAELREWVAVTRQAAEEHGGLMPLAEGRAPFGGWGQIPLKEPLGPPAPRPYRASDETEAELTGVIADCRALMREVAMQSARLTCGPDERLRFIDSACRAALAAAKVGRTVSQLRAATGGAMAENRQRIIVERVERNTAG